MCTGNPYSTKTEIFDMKNPNYQCTNAPQFPKNLLGATGQWINETTILICGGYNIVSSRVSIKECFIGQDGSFRPSNVNLQEPRGFSSSVIENQDMLIFGGSNTLVNQQSSHFNTIERVSLKTETSHVAGILPFTFSYGCVLKYNQEVMVVAGSQNRTYSSATWTASIANLYDWNPGPSLQEKRDDQACGVLSNLNIGIVAGGNYLKSTELINFMERNVVLGEKYSLVKFKTAVLQLDSNAKKGGRALSRDNRFKRREIQISSVK